MNKKNIALLSLLLSFNIFAIAPKERDAIFKEPTNFNTWVKEKKLDYLWDIANKSAYSVLPREVHPLDAIKTGFFKSSFPAFVLNSDFRSYRKKLIHTYGTLAKASLIISNNGATNPYTGLFRTGSIGLIRLSTGVVSDTAFSPGISLKLLIDHFKSVNIVTLFSLDGQGPDKNFFKHPQANELPEAKGQGGKLLQFLFEVALKGIRKAHPELDDGGTVGWRPLKQMALIKANGEKESSPVWPRNIYFVPVLDWSKSSNYSEDYRTRLGTIPDGTIIYKVFVSKPGINTFLSYDQGIEIGFIRLDSKFNSNEFSDTVLNFQHMM